MEAKNPGDINDQETKAFEARMRTEAEDLKLESFGIEVSPLHSHSASHTSAAAHDLGGLHHESGQFHQVSEVLRRRLFRPIEREGRYGERGMGLVRICVSCNAVSAY